MDPPLPVSAVSFTRASSATLRGKRTPMVKFLDWLRRRGRREDFDLVDREGKAFASVVEKFARIQYLADKKTVMDVVEKTPVGICITNERGLYEYVNAAYTRLYGYSYDELIGQSFTIVVPEEHRAELVELHDRFMHRQYELEGEWQVVRRDGRRMTILANAAYVLDEQEKPKKITFVLDITARKRAEAELESETRRRGELESFLRGPLRESLRALAERADETGGGAGTPSTAALLQTLARDVDALLQKAEKP